MGTRRGCREELCAESAARAPDGQCVDAPSAGAEAPHGRLHIHIEGWRGIPHSYAVAASDLVAELAKRCALVLTWSDAPMPAGMAGVATPTAALRAPSRVRVLPYGEVPDGATVLRITWPYNLSAPAARGSRAIIFATAEHLGCPHNSLLPGSPPFDKEQPTVSLLTPTFWSLEGLVACGVRRARIGVAPHGVGPALLSAAAEAAAPKLRAAERRRRGWDGRYVFLHVGAATANKGLPILRGAYAALVHRVGTASSAAQGQPARAPLLVLKGLDRRPSKTICAPRLRTAARPRGSGMCSGLATS